jgi:hypothetical protein
MSDGFRQLARHRFAGSASMATAAPTMRSRSAIWTSSPFCAMLRAMRISSRETGADAAFAARA